MKVIRLRGRDTVYSSNVYLVLGTSNKKEDLNTLVDVGPDAFILSEVWTLSTGVGKLPIEQVVVTHNKSNHAAGLPSIRAAFEPKVFAGQMDHGVDQAVADGDWIRMGDREFEVLHVPEQSSDSICLLCHEEGILFSGDALLSIRQTGGTHSPRYIAFLENLIAMKIKQVYPGHGDPISCGIQEMLSESLHNATGRIAAYEWA